MTEAIGLDWRAERTSVKRVATGCASRSFEAVLRLIETADLPACLSGEKNRKATFSRGAYERAAIVPSVVLGGENVAAKTRFSM